MEQHNLISRCYDALGYKIKISTNSTVWADEAARYVALPPVSAEVESDIDLILIETDSAAVDEYIDLPGEEMKAAENTLILNREVPFKTYIDNDRRLRWVDFIGYGRMFLDYEKGKAIAVRFVQNGITRHYSNILFVYNNINSLLSRFQFYEVHASSVRVGSKGLLFTGHSGRGKSTACCALLQKGYPVLSDEKILLYATGQGQYGGVSISDVIKIREQAVQRFFPDLVQQEPLCQTEGEYSFKVGQIHSQAWLASASIDYLLVVQQSGEEKTRLERISPARVVGEFFPVTLKHYERFALDEKFHFLMDFLNSVPCYQLFFGTDMDDFVLQIEGLAREGET